MLHTSTMRQIAEGSDHRKPDRKIPPYGFFGIFGDDIRKLAKCSERLISARRNTIAVSHYAFNPSVHWLVHFCILLQCRECLVTQIPRFCFAEIKSPKDFLQVGNENILCLEESIHINIIVTVLR